MPPDSPMQSSEHHDGPSGKIVDEIEWATFVKTLKETGAWIVCESRCKTMSPTTAAQPRPRRPARQWHLSPTQPPRRSSHERNHDTAQRNRAGR